MRIEVSAYLNDTDYKDDAPYWVYLFDPEDEDRTKTALRDIKNMLGKNSHIVLKTITKFEV